jgi:hypothetical protein
LPELVEGLSFPFPSPRKEGQGFDKLSLDGLGLVKVHR